MPGPQPDLAGVLGQASVDKRIDILRRIGAAGSISEAARAAGVSYKAAWQAIDTLGNLAGMPLVEKLVGGAGGGGATLTAAGRRVLEAADRLAAARAEVLAMLEAGARGSEGAAGLAALGLRTSMRNQFPCAVDSLSARDGLVRVGLRLPTGQALHARITRESSQLLGLARGMPVLALCKATAVTVAGRLEPAPLRNLLEGRVTRLSRSAKGGEAALQLGEGLSLVGFVQAGHGARIGHPAMAGVDESGVVVALAN